MINFDMYTLKEFLKENVEFLTGARIQKIQQPTRQELVFAIRNHAKTRKLYININPSFFHVCFMSEANEKKRWMEIPKQPPMFCMLLRKYIESARIAKVQQPEGERILEFYFETYNEVSDKIYLCLAVELMGKHSNVVLYNYDTNVIIGCAHNVGDDKSRERHLMGELPYVYPKKNTRKNYIELIRHLIDSGEFTNSVNDSIDSYYARYQESEKVRALKSKLFAVMNTKLKKIKVSLEKLQKQQKSAQKADLYRKKGDLVMSNLYAQKDFVSFIDVFDYEKSENIRIELDETKTLKENANKFYKLYNKSKTTSLKTQEFIEKHLADKDYCEQVLYSIDCASNLEDLKEIADEIQATHLQNSDGKNLKKRHDFKENLLFVRFSDTVGAYIGKNNKQNDYIISKLAKDDDLWFHTKDCAGSHVLLKGSNEFDEKTIFECAKIAKEHSSGKNSSKIGVIYTKSKYLRKPPGANLGYVTYKNEQEIVID